MKQILLKLTVLGGLLLVTGVACTDQPDSRAASTTSALDSTPEATGPIEAPLTYTVARGDFLAEIADRFNVTLDDLVEVNQIENVALIEVGQVLTIPGGTTTVVDLFALEPAERWPEIYPPQELPPAAEPTLLQEIRNRLAALPWPPRETIVSNGVIAGFALTALVGGLVLTPVEYRSRRWVRRSVPRAARRVQHQARALWARTANAGRAVWRVILAIDRRYRRLRTLVILGWARTRGPRQRLAAWALPLLIRAVDGTRDRTRALVDTIRHRAPEAAEGFNSFGARASRGIRSGSGRARGDIFEQPASTSRWRTPLAGELATAFERRQLQVRYVPVIDLDTHTLSAVEAQLFWQHPQRGLLAARDIHAATQQHPEIGAALLEFVLEQSCAFLQDQIDPRFPSAQLIVPVTLEQIVDSEPLAAIDRGLTSASLALDRLKVSIAEPDALQDPHTAAAFIRNLRSMGIGVHLDGYAKAQADDLRYLGVSSVIANFAAANGNARNTLAPAIEAAQDLRLPVTARHNGTESARALQVSLGCAFEAVGQPIPPETLVSKHVSPPASTTRPAAVAPTSDPGAQAEARPTDDAAVAPPSAETLVEKQTRRPAGPLRISRPSFNRPDLQRPAVTDSTPEAFDAGTDHDDDRPEPSPGESDDEPSDAAFDASSRPVDAA